jgi:hypothetical protein
MNTDKRALFTAAVVAATVALCACSEAPTPAKTETAKQEPAKAPEAITAQRAFYELYKPARGWATDLLALSVASGEVPNIKNEEGKAGLWTVVFVSPSLKQARKFTWAAAPSGTDIIKGVNISDALPWGGATPQSMPFSNSQFAVDSDAACKAASEKAAEWLKTHQESKPTFRLGNASRFGAPVWYVQWGSTSNGYAALVNATTGSIVMK